MKEKAFPVSMALLWGMVFSQAMHSMTLGVCMGLLMGSVFGLFDSGKGGKEDEYKIFKIKMLYACGAADVRRSDVTDYE